MTAAKSQDEKSAVDVARPGKSAASPTTKPIITGHQLLPQDPMVSGSQSLKPDKPKIVQTKIKPELKIEPADKNELETAPDKASPSAAASESKTDNQPAVEDEATASDNNRPAKLAPKDQPPSIDQAHQQLVDKLVADKKYFLPIQNTKQQRSTRQFLVTFLVVLVVGLVVIDLLIDSGLIKSNIQVPLKLFKK